MDPTDAVQNYYDQQSESEWRRFERHPMELAITLRALKGYMPEPPARVLDIGGGPGRYSIELAKKGYKVSLFDLSNENLRLAGMKAAEMGAVLERCQQGNAIDLAAFADGDFNAVLLMGPLYHLLEEKERKQALAEACRVCKPGGMLFISFITRYAGLLDMAMSYPERILDVADMKLERHILKTGKLPPRSTAQPEFVAYLAQPAEVVPLAQSAGLKVLRVIGVEGFGGLNEQAVNRLPQEAFNAWVDLNYQVMDDPCLLGMSMHLLMVATKPSP
ncbi:MAG: class I SAM-dependent methyltransferase [Omnitrophica WOR_2 bacterium]